MYHYTESIMNERAFAFIYGCALRDAVLQKAFTGKRAWIIDVAKARKSVKAYIDRILNGDFPEDGDKDAHDKLFLETAKAVCQALNSYEKKPDGAGSFSFGNAQKLINMTVKHVYLHTYTISRLATPSFRDRFRHCHCPMDSIMLKKVRDLKKDGLSSGFLKPWGKEDFKGGESMPDRYCEFQTAIRDMISTSGGDIFPIEFDFAVWKSDNTDDAMEK